MYGRVYISNYDDSNSLTSYKLTAIQINEDLELSKIIRLLQSSKLTATS